VRPWLGSPSVARKQAPLQRAAARKRSAPADVGGPPAAEPAADPQPTAPGGEPPTRQAARDPQRDESRPPGADVEAPLEGFAERLSRVQVGIRSLKDDMGKWLERLSS
jgi:hypothetical protein